MVYLFLGPSGSGKDTQVDLVAEKIPLERISTGEMFRTMYEEKDSLGIKAHDEYWSKGLFNPDDQVFALLERWLKRYDPNKHWAIVGAVRRGSQIPLLDEVLKKYGKKLDAVVNFNLPIEAAIERRTLRRVCEECGANYHQEYKPPKIEGVCDKCGGKLYQREDDTEEKTRSLMKEYNKGIEGIREKYMEQGIWIDIDASPTIGEIHKVVCEKLGIK